MYQNKRCSAIFKDGKDGAMKEKETYHCGTGGFQAIAHVEDKELYRLELKFVLTEWDVDIDEQN